MSSFVQPVYEGIGLFCFGVFSTARNAHVRFINRQWPNSVSLVLSFVPLYRVIVNQPLLAGPGDFLHYSVINQNTHNTLFKNPEQMFILFQF